MSDNTAILAGFTQEYIAEGGGLEVHIFVQLDADLDGEFKAYDADNCEFITVFGWNVTLEAIEVDDGPFCCALS